MNSKIFYIDDDSVYFLACFDNDGITEKNKLLKTNSPILRLPGSEHTLVMSLQHNPLLEDLFKVSEVKFDDRNFGEDVYAGPIAFYLEKLIQEGIDLHMIKDEIPLKNALGFFLACGNACYFVHTDGGVERMSTSFGQYRCGYSYGAFEALKGVKNIDHKLLLAHRASCNDGDVINQFPILIIDTKTMEPRVYDEEYVLKLEEAYRKGELD